MSKVIGLTGQTGAGKSTVREILSKQGAAVIDADEVAHDISDNNLDCLVQIAEKFSCLVLNDQGKLNRKALARMVFTDRRKLLALDKIIFPYIREEIQKEIAALEAEGKDVIVIDGATLIESGCDKACWSVVSVTAEEGLRAQRVVRRDHLSKANAMSRIKSQYDDAYYIERSGFVICNNGTMRELEEKTLLFYKMILEGRKSAPKAEGKPEEPAVTEA
ncbi:MAG TPA: dephospho-CoA kinase [Oscillospiraceae bacterium]|nr:dephospho-CoA kinase [Oscillospiraceae bacterium]HQQ89158.1 dephospho-CoA kinase [Oscillospiraceae bacterium]HRW56205.1 dephospho-CoA kinase [Oscillospiraceae bacterium]